MINLETVTKQQILTTCWRPKDLHPAAPWDYYDHFIAYNSKDETYYLVNGRGYIHAEHIFSFLEDLKLFLKNWEEPYE